MGIMEGSAAFSEMWNEEVEQQCSHNTCNTGEVGMISARFVNMFSRQVGNVGRSRREHKRIETTASRPQVIRALCYAHEYWILWG